MFMNTAKIASTRIVTPLVIIAMLVNLASCGTILYPERHNQKAGQIDPAVAILDGVGLLFFIIPGVIAFAVDFSNHSIYLPHGHSSNRFSKIHFDKKMDQAAIEEIVLAETGVAVDLRQPNISITRLDSVSDLDSAFALHEANGRIASAR
jgi:hypothetical protein